MRKGNDSKKKKIKKIYSSFLWRLHWPPLQCTCGPYFWFVYSLNSSLRFYIHLPQLDIAVAVAIILELQSSLVVRLIRSQVLIIAIPFFRLKYPSMAVEAEMECLVSWVESVLATRSCLLVELSQTWLGFVLHHVVRRTLFLGGGDWMKIDTNSIASF